MSSFTLDSAMSVLHRTPGTLAEMLGELGEESVRVSQ